MMKNGLAVLLTLMFGMLGLNSKSLLAEPEQHLRHAPTVSFAVAQYLTTRKRGNIKNIEIATPLEAATRAIEDVKKSLLTNPAFQERCR